MWVYFKKQSVLFDLADYAVSTDYSVEMGVVNVYAGDDNLPLMTWPKDTLEMYVSQLAEALKHNEAVFVFDEDKPKFKMRLSGNEEDVPQDVGLE